MSFGLLTAVNVEDVPQILRNCAGHYRNTVTKNRPDLWHMVAAEIEQFADQLAIRIDEAKAQPEKRIRVRLKT